MITQEEINRYNNTISPDKAKVSKEVYNSDEMPSDQDETEVREENNLPNGLEVDPFSNYKILNPYLARHLIKIGKKIYNRNSNINMHYRLEGNVEDDITVSKEAVDWKKTLLVKLLHICSSSPIPSLEKKLKSKQDSFFDYRIGKRHMHMSLGRISRDKSLEPKYQYTFNLFN